MSISLNPAISKSLSPLDASQKAVIKKNQDGTTDAVKMQFAEMIEGKTAAAERDVITSDEKKFFSKLFPQAASAIDSYTSYTPAGTKKPAALGTIIDVKK